MCDIKQKSLFKGIVYPKNENSVIIYKQVMVAIDFYNIFYILWKSMATINCLVPDILQNIFFCAQQKKESHTGLKQRRR